MKTRGFTLLEILFVIAILMMIIGVVAQFQVNVLNFSKSSSDSLQSSQDARSILAVMVRELRSVKPGNNGAYPVIQAATSSITFYSDTDSDGLREQIRYFLSSTTLKKGSIVPTGTNFVYNPASETLATLATNIKNSTSTDMFQYYDNTYTGTSSPLSQPVNLSSVRLVRINLLIDADPNRSPLPRMYSSQVMLRNLKDNL